MHPLLLRLLVVASPAVVVAPFACGGQVDARASAADASGPSAGGGTSTGGGVAGVAGMDANSSGAGGATPSAGTGGSTGGGGAATAGTGGAMGMSGSTGTAGATGTSAGSAGTAGATGTAGSTAGATGTAGSTAGYWGTAGNAGSPGNAGAGGVVGDVLLPKPDGSWIIDGCDYQTLPTPPSSCGFCCIASACYVPLAGEKCLSFKDAGAQGKISLGGGGIAVYPCAIPEGNGPFIAPPDVPPQVGAPGACCYLAGFQHCAGRPLMLSGAHRVARLRLRSDWS